MDSLNQILAFTAHARMARQLMMFLRNHEPTANLKTSSCRHRRYWSRGLQMQVSYQLALTVLRPHFMQCFGGAVNHFSRKIATWNSDHWIRSDVCLGGTHSREVFSGGYRRRVAIQLWKAGECNQGEFCTDSWLGFVEGERNTIVIAHSGVRTLPRYVSARASKYKKEARLC